MVEALVASVVVALVSVSGALVFGGQGRVTGTHRFILPFAVGVFLGIVFFELVPETIELSSSLGPPAILIGFFGFYFFSHLLSTYHHHDGPDNHASESARKLLIGDAIHNVADGVVIATAFFVNPVLGVVTTLGIMLHELPQEIAEFGVLLCAGYTKRKAMALNLFSASSIIFGVFIATFFAIFAHEYAWVITGLAAGNLLYIATSDFIPELRESHKDHFYEAFLATLCGVLLIFIALYASHGFLEYYEPVEIKGLEIDFHPH